MGSQRATLFIVQIVALVLIVRFLHPSLPGGLRGPLR